MSGRNWMLVTALFTGAFIVMIDVSIVIVALPTLQTSLNTDIAGLQWIVDAYSLCLSAFLLTAGSLGDRYGRRKLWLLGIVVFVSGSAFCAASRTYEALVAGRIVQGIGGALLIPGPLSIIFQVFSDPKQRAHIIGAWASFSGFALIVGPVLGGILITRFGWPSVFLINLPIGAIAVALGYASIPESSDPSHTSLDPVGQILSVLCLGGLTYGLIRGGNVGWLAPSTIKILLGAVIALAIFIVVERASKKPMLPISLFSSSIFSAAVIASFVIGFSAFTSSFFLSLFFQRIQGLDPDRAGWQLAPQFLSVAIVSTASGYLSHRFGGWRLMTLSFALMGVALVGLSTIAPARPFDHIVPWLVLLGIGMGLAIPTTNGMGIAVAPRERSGGASATLNAARQTGYSIGIALVGAVMNAYAASALAGSLKSVGIADSARVAARGLAGHWREDGTIGSASMSHFASGALLTGFHMAVTVTGCVSLAVSVYLFIFRKRAPQPR